MEWREQVNDYVIKFKMECSNAETGFVATATRQDAYPRQRPVVPLLSRGQLFAARLFFHLPALDDLRLVTRKAGVFAQHGPARADVAIEKI